MGFSLQNWQDSVYERLVAWRTRMQSAQVESVYLFLSAVALSPMLEAFRQGDLSALLAAGGVLSGVGANLLVNCLQQWRDARDDWQKAAITQDRFG